LSQSPTSTFFPFPRPPQCFFDPLTTPGLYPYYPWGRPTHLRFCHVCGAARTTGVRPSLMGSAPHSFFRIFDGGLFFTPGVGLEHVFFVVLCFFPLPFFCYPSCRFFFPNCVSLELVFWDMHPFPCPPPAPHLASTF